MDKLTDWTQKEICSKLEFKKPSSRGDASYNYELTAPAVYPCFNPAEDKSPTPRAPSVTIQIDKFRETLESEMSADIAFIFVIWNTGIHDNRDPQNKKFEKNIEGWRDLWHFMDTARNAILKNFNIAGFEISGEITGRPLMGDDTITGTYPFFYGEMTCTIKTISSTAAALGDIQKLL